MNDPAQHSFDRLFGPEFGHGKPFDLTRLKATLKQLGDPQTKLPPAIHVAGTNGKGSTIAFMRAIAEAAGLKVYAFTKPHLFALNERFLVAGAPADDAILIVAAGRIAAIDNGITQFDAQAAAAFMLFSETPADLALIETGMGGRDDSTNVVTPALSVITPIGLDHQDALGATLAEIAAHKAGILKPNTPAVIARQDSAALDVIEREAMRLSAPLWRQSMEWDAFPSAGRLVVQTETRALDLPPPGLAGGHQIDNAGLACAALLRLGLRIHDDAFAEGVANASWPGRLTPLKASALNALAPGAEIWVDAGHNAHAARALAQALETMNRKRPARTALILGLRARKDWRAFVQILAPYAARIIGVPLADAHAPPEDIAEAARAAGADASTANDLRRALVEARGAGRILICGSFLLAAEALSSESD